MDDRFSHEIAIAASLHRFKSLPHSIVLNESIKRSNLFPSCVQTSDRNLPTFDLSFFAGYDFIYFKDIYFYFIYISLQDTILYILRIYLIRIFLFYIYFFASYDFIYFKDIYFYFIYISLQDMILYILRIYIFIYFKGVFWIWRKILRFLGLTILCIFQNCYFIDT